jgi:hypothetical protein
MRLTFHFTSWSFQELVKDSAFQGLEKIEWFPLQLRNESGSNSGQCKPSCATFSLFSSHTQDKVMTVLRQ